MKCGVIVLEGNNPLYKRVLTFEAASTQQWLVKVNDFRIGIYLSCKLSLWCIRHTYAVITILILYYLEMIKQWPNPKNYILDSRHMILLKNLILEERPVTPRTSQSPAPGIKQVNTVIR